MAICSEISPNSLKKESLVIPTHKKGRLLYLSFRWIVMSLVLSYADLDFPTHKKGHCNIRFSCQVNMQCYEK